MALFFLAIKIPPWGLRYPVPNGTARRELSAPFRQQIKYKEEMMNYGRNKERSPAMRAR
jgi:hypothetical protein